MFTDPEVPEYLRGNISYSYQIYSYQNLSASKDGSYSLTANHAGSQGKKQPPQEKEQARRQSTRGNRGHVKSDVVHNTHGRPPFVLLSLLIHSNRPLLLRSQGGYNKSGNCGGQRWLGYDRGSRYGLGNPEVVRAREVV